MEPPPRSAVLKIGLAGTAAVGLRGSRAASLTARRRTTVSAVRRGVVAQDIDVPWNICFLPGYEHPSALVSSRDSGDLLLVDAESTYVVHHFKVVSRPVVAESGLLGLALHPDFSTNRLVYAYLTTRADNRVVRFPSTARPSAARSRSSPASVPPTTTTAAVSRSAPTGCSTSESSRAGMSSPPGARDS